MKQIGNTKYYSKRDIMERLGCCLTTINNKIVAGKIEGIYIGRGKYYTEAQVKQIFETRTYKPETK